MICDWMSREQLKFISGTPTYQIVCRHYRRDYPYYNKPGYGTPEHRKITVWFEGDSLVRWSGDEQPSVQPFQQEKDNANNADEPPLTYPEAFVEDHYAHSCSRCQRSYWPHVDRCGI